MRRFLISQVLHRRGRTLTLAVGILVAAVSFTLLTSAARTSELTVKRTVAENFRPAYDILVRPPDSFNELERSRGLVRQNYLSGIYGGISVQQWRRIQRIPGAEVAAPIANVGYIMPFTFIPFTINEYLNDDQFQLYRLRYTWVANGGLSRYPDSSRFIYYTRRDRLRVGTNRSLEEVLPNGDSVRPCNGFMESNSRRAYTSPFDDRNLEGLLCYSARSPLRYAFSDYGPFPRGKVGAAASAYFPVFIAAIDPVEEQKLIDFDGTITEGRGVRAAESARRVNLFGYPARVIPYWRVPVHTSMKSYRSAWSGCKCRHPRTFRDVYRKRTIRIDGCALCREPSSAPKGGHSSPCMTVSLKTTWTIPSNGKTTASLTPAIGPRPMCDMRAEMKDASARASFATIRLSLSRATTVPGGLRNKTLTPISVNSRITR